MRFDLVIYATISLRKKNILKSPAYTLEITNAQTKEVYNDDEVMVPKNSSVIVKRVPVQRLAPVTGQEGMSKVDRCYSNYTISCRQELFFIV